MLDLQITDKRQLTFDRGIVIEALRQPSRISKKLALPSRPPNYVRLMPARGEVELVYSEDAAMSRFEEKRNLNCEQISAVLIEYCIRCRIPLPRDSSKSIMIENDALILSCKKVMRL